jgi:hypothetical protein
MIILFIFSCKESGEIGEINFKVEYTTDINTSSKSTCVIDDQLHSGFGTFVTSLTPYHFSASINMMGMQDSTIDPGGNTTIMLGFIMHDGSDMIAPDPQADFSNNQEVEFFPKIGHQVTPGQQIDFVYFYFVPYYIYQEVTLPVEYQNITINQFNEVYPVGYFGIPEEQFQCDLVKFGNTLKIKYQPFITRLHPYPAGYPRDIVFGNTDSTFIFNKEGNTIYTSIDNPFGAPDQGVKHCIIRSDKYSVSTVTIPEDDQSITVRVTLSFDTRNLIQVYAGQDNIPYTSDDIFLYAPKYWERIQVKLESAIFHQ